MGRVASGHVNRECELLRRAKLGDQPFQRLAQVSHSSLAGNALTVSAHTGTQLASRCGYRAEALPVRSRPRAGSAVRRGARLVGDVIGDGQR